MWNLLYTPTVDLPRVDTPPVSLKWHLAAGTMNVHAQAGSAEKDSTVAAGT